MMKNLMTTETVIKRLNHLGFALPSASIPGGNYVSVNVRGKVAYISIQFPIINGEYFFRGRLGETLSTEDGYKAMQLCGLNVLSQIQHKLGFHTVLGLNHIDAYFQSCNNWDSAPAVVNGASDLFVNALGDAGLHSRSILGVQHLSRNFSVGLSASLTLI